MAEITVQKVGIKFDPAALVLTYTKGFSTRRRTIPVRNMSKNADVDNLVADLQSQAKHNRFLSQLTKLQLLRMVTLIQDHIKGLSLEESLDKCKKLEHIDPEEDLNKADAETLNIKKAAMDESFTQNQKKPTDPDFEYDKRVDFGSNDAVETLNWSDDDDDFEF